MGFWSDLLPMGGAEKLKEETKKMLIDKFRLFAENEGRKSKIAEDKARAFINSESWENFKNLCCYLPFPYDPQEDTIFCLGLTGWGNNREGTIGVAVKTLEGIYKSAFPCPYWHKVDCPLREGLARKEEEIKRKVDF